MGPRSDPVEKPENRWLDRFDPSIHRFDCAAAPEGRADREDPRWQLRYSTAATPILRQTSAATGDGFLFVPSSLAAGTQLLPPILGPRHPASQAPGAMRAAKHTAATAPGMGGARSTAWLQAAWSQADGLGTNKQGGVSNCGGAAKLVLRFDFGE